MKSRKSQESGSSVTPLIRSCSLALLAAITALSSAKARADLVYEENIAPGSATANGGMARTGGTPPATAVQQAPAAVTQVQQQAFAQAPAPAVAPAPVLAPVPAYSNPVQASNDDTDQPTRAELMRRERLREEVKNEDVLQARLEELRLRDEERRTQQILAPASAGSESAEPAPVTSNFAASPQPTQVQEQVIVAPATEHPGQPATQPVVDQEPEERAPSRKRQSHPMLASAATSSTLNSDSGSWNSATASNPDVGDRPSITVQPRLGLSGMIGNTGYQVDPHFSTGVSVGFVATDHLAVDIGYQYSEFGVALASSNPFVQSVQMMDGYGTDTMVMKQNLVDAGVRFYLLNPDSTLRPFVGGGLGYAKSFINYSQAILSQSYMQGMSADYGLSQYLGFISAGFDVKMSKNISLGFLAKYYDVFASTEDGYLNNMAFYNPMYYGGWHPGSFDKQYVSGSLAGMNFFSVLGDVTFSF